MNGSPAQGLAGAKFLGHRPLPSFTTISYGDLYAPGGMGSINLLNTSCVQSATSAVPYKGKIIRYEDAQGGMSSQKKQRIALELYRTRALNYWKWNQVWNKWNEMEQGCKFHDDVEVGSRHLDCNRTSTLLGDEERSEYSPSLCSR